MMNTPAATAAAAARALSRTSSRVRPAPCMQSLSFHTTAAADKQQSSLRRNEACSFEEPNALDVCNYGYRVVVRSNSHGNLHRGYTTSSVCSSSIYTEEYDDYTTYTGGSTEHGAVKYDLGSSSPSTVVGGGLDSILQFDEAGFVKPCWETEGGNNSTACDSSGSSSSSSMEEPAEWILRNGSTMKEEAVSPPRTSNEEL